METPSKKARYDSDGEQGSEEDFAEKLLEGTMVMLLCSFENREMLLHNEKSAIGIASFRRRLSTSETDGF